MSIYLVHTDRTLHTCPASQEPHPVDIRRTVLAVTDGGPCRNPITIRCGSTVATIACGRHEPAHRQCGACRVIVTEHTITDTFLGYQGPPNRRPTNPVTA